MKTRSKKEAQAVLRIKTLYAQADQIWKKNRKLDRETIQYNDPIIRPNNKPLN